MLSKQNFFKEENLPKILKKGGVAVIPTDTLYGLVGKAQNISTVNRIYKLKKRAPEKPCIILISEMSELEKFSVVLSDEQKKALNNFWPGPVSVILDCIDESLSYLHRGTKTLAFRQPSNKILIDLLSKVGPLIAPSANPEGLPPAEDISGAREYFGDSVDFYLDGGKIIGKASRLIKLLKDGSISIIRQ